MHYNPKGCTRSPHCVSLGLIIIFFRGETQNMNSYKVSVSISRRLFVRQWQSYFSCLVSDMYSQRSAFIFMHTLILIVLQIMEDLSSKSDQSTLFQWLPGFSEAQSSKDKAACDNADRCGEDKWIAQMKVHRLRISDNPLGTHFNTREGVLGLLLIRISQKPALIIPMLLQLSQAKEMQHLRCLSSN